MSDTELLKKKKGIDHDKSEIFHKFHLKICEFIHLYVIMESSTHFESKTCRLHQCFARDMSSHLLDTQL